MNLQAAGDVIWLPTDASIADIAETMIALANRTGGMLALAADNNTENLRERMVEACFATDPALIVPTPAATELEGKSCVVAAIPPGLPHVYAYQGRYLVRDGDKNLPLSTAMLRYLILQRGEISFEMTPAQGATLDDIDWEKARDYTRKLTGFHSQEAQDILLRRGCLTRTENGILPTYAGILLFGRDPQRFVRNSDLVAVRFPTETMSDAFSRQDIAGTLPEQIRGCEMFLATHLQKRVLLGSGMERQETHEIPMEAARELVVNAVAHRDYSIQGDNIHLYLFGNRMEVHSPGKLPGTMTVANLRDERFSRNPAIVQVLSDLNFIERLGYGLDRVIELMQTYQLQAPEFVERNGGFHVILYKGSAAETPSAETAVQEVVTTDFRGVYNGQEINSRQEVALAFLLKSGKHRITNGELKDLLPDVHPETLRRDLVDLVSKEILVKLGQKRGSYYVLKERNSP